MKIVDLKQKLLNQNHQKQINKSNANNDSDDLYLEVNTKLLDNKMPNDHESGGGLLLKSSSNMPLTNLPNNHHQHSNKQRLSGILWSDMQQQQQLINNQQQSRPCHFYHKNNLLPHMLSLNQRRGSASLKKNGESDMIHNEQQQKQQPSSATSAYLQQSLLNYEFLIELEKVMQKQFSPIIGNIIKTIDHREKQILNKKRTQEIQDEWADVAHITDKILCYFFIFFTLGSCFFIFYNSPHFFSDW